MKRGARISTDSSSQGVGAASTESATRRSRAIIYGCGLVLLVVAVAAGLGWSRAHKDLGAARDAQVEITRRLADTQASIAATRTANRELESRTQTLVAHGPEVSDAIGAAASRFAACDDPADSRAGLAEHASRVEEEFPVLIGLDWQLLLAAAIDVECDGR